MSRWGMRFACVGLVVGLIASGVAALIAVAPAVAATTPTFSLSNADIYDSGYNQSSTSVLTVTESPANAGFSTPYIQSSSPGTGFTCGAPYSSTATTYTCTITAAPGPANGDDSGVIGANGTPNTVTVAETDGTGTTTAKETMIIYPGPICADSGTNPWTGAAGTAGAAIAPNDATYASPANSGFPSAANTDAEGCANGAPGPASSLLTNVSTPSAAGTIFTASSPIDAAGGTALEIEAGPGFNWTGGVGNGEADVDTGTAGLSDQAWGTKTETVTNVAVSSGSNMVSTTGTSVPADFPTATGAYSITVSGTGIPADTTVSSGAGTGTLTLSNNATATSAGETLTFTWSTMTVTLVAVSSGSNMVSTTGSSVPTTFPSAVGTSGWLVSGTGIPNGTTVTGGAGTGTLTLSNNATATSAGETLTFTWTGSAPPSGFVTSAPSVAEESNGTGARTGFDSSGDPLNVCPPEPAMIEAGASFCDEEYETTGSGPSATQIALDQTGQAVPTTTQPTVALSSPSGSIGSSVSMTDAAGACPGTVGTGTTGQNLFNGTYNAAGTSITSTYNCWYARAGDPSPVTVTVGGVPATVNPTPTTTTVTNVAIVDNTSSVADWAKVTATSVPAAFPTNLVGDEVSGLNIPPGTTVTQQGTGTSGDYAPQYLELSQPATSTSPGETLTFTNDADVSEADYSVDASSTITVMNVQSGSKTVSCSATSAGTATAPYTGLLGDGVSGTDIPYGTEVTDVNNSGSGTCSFTLSNAASANAAVTLTFYPITLNPPQLNATFTIAAGTPTGNQTVEVCEATTPKNGNDWEFGIQWMTPSGSLQYISGNSGPTEVCGSSTLDVTLANSSTSTTPASTSIVLGASNTDSATVTGSVNGIDPTGSVSFYDCGPTASAQSCTPSGSPFDTETLSAAANPATVTSASFTPTSTGYWCFAGVYSGDPNYSSSSDTTTDECFDVTTAGSSTSTGPTSPIIVLGNSDTDSATVTGNAAGGSPTGSVSFTVCGPTAAPTQPVPCTATESSVGSAVDLTAGANDTSTAVSAAFTPTATGYWCFDNTYSGDGNYDFSSDNTTDECFEVNSASTSTGTTPGTVGIVLGESDNDLALVTGNAAGGSPTGTVSFYECGPTASAQPCTPSGSPFDTESVTGGANDTSTATSASVTPPSSGWWCFAGVYSGDSNYLGSTDATTDECFDVGAASSSTSTAPSSSSIVLGNSNTDAATVTGNAAGGSPTGSVGFTVCGPTAAPTPPVPCTATESSVGSAVGLTSGAGDTSTATSAAFTPTSTGYWCFDNTYSGDSNYSASSDNTTDECFDVTAANTSTSTVPSSSTIVLGNSNTDVATVTGNAAGGSPTGTVGFTVCGPTLVPTAPVPCTATESSVGSSVGLTAGAGDTSTATSAAFTPTSTGYWCFDNTYSGDSNYSASSDNTTDECFDVTVASSSTTTTPTSRTAALGGTDTDVATVTGNAAGGSPTGTVSFYECGPTPTPAACTSIANPVGGPVALNPAGGDTSTATSPSFTPTAVGYWCFAAVYSGDINYSGSSDVTTLECFDVTPTTTSLRTVPTDSSILLGQADTDLGTVTGNSVGGSPTGSMTFYECGPSSAATPCTSMAEMVGNPVNLSAGPGNTATATSAPFVPTAVGYWCFAGYFSGDSSYNASSDLTVDECVDVQGALTMVTSSLPSGTKGEFYTVTLVARGGKAPYTWLRETGIMPKGLTLTSAGVLSGVPKKAGTFTLSIRVKDSSRPIEKVTRSFTVKIAS